MKFAAANGRTVWIRASAVSAVLPAPKDGVSLVYVLGTNVPFEVTEGRDQVLIAMLAEERGDAGKDVSRAVAGWTRGGRVFAGNLRRALRRTGLKLAEAHREFSPGAEEADRAARVVLALTEEDDGCG